VDTASFLESLQGLARDDFVARSPHPFLIQLTESQPQPSGDVLTLLPDLETATGEAVAVHSLTKREGSNKPFGFMITLGRATNSDVIIEHPAVSSFHLYFRQLGDTWQVADANSSFGTRVDGNPLPVERGRKILPGASIVLADRVSLEVMTAAEVWDHLAA
jgi:pSer/pThr/pTyr-binding forkhead associated (FHA) protein